MVPAEGWEYTHRGLYQNDRSCKGTECPNIRNLAHNVHLDRETVTVLSQSVMCGSVYLPRQETGGASFCYTCCPLARNLRTWRVPFHAARSLGSGCPS